MAKKYQKLKVLGIIPARGNSKRLPGKNIKLLGGKPLIAYSIEAALGSKKISKVIVSTDDTRIRKISEEYGAQVPFLRPKKLAGDSAPMYPVIRHVVDFLEKKGEVFDIIVILQPTSPLRRSIDIDHAVNKLIKTKADSVVSLCLTEHSPYWMKVIRDGKVYSLFKSRESVERQDLPRVYRLNGALYITRRKILFESSKILGRDVRAFKMSTEMSIDIDTKFDFALAEMILKNKGCR
ncbi:MAG: acylneuraminate cytidylyltransferase family protein [Candidatus Omnitrophota bacterium]